MSETKKSGKKAPARKTVKAASAQGEKAVTVEEKASTRTTQDVLESVRALVGVTEAELKGLVDVGMKYVAKMAEAQEVSISRDRALARAAHAFANIADRLGVAAEKVGTNADRVGVALHKVGNLVAFTADMLDHNEAAVRATVGAWVWETGLRAVQTVAAALGQDVHQATAEWVATAEARQPVQESKPSVEMGGTKPVEQRPQHHKKERREKQQRPLKATLGEQMAAKGLVPTEPAPPATPAAE